MTTIHTRWGEIVTINDDADGSLEITIVRPSENKAPQYLRPITDDCDECSFHKFHGKDIVACRLTRYEIADSRRRLKKTDPKKNICKTCKHNIAYHAPPPALAYRRKSRSTKMMGF